MIHYVSKNVIKYTLTNIKCTLSHINLSLNSDYIRTDIIFVTNISIKCYEFGLGEYPPHKEKREEEENTPQPPALILWQDFPRHIDTQKKQRGQGKDKPTPPPATIGTTSRNIHTRQKKTPHPHKANQCPAKPPPRRARGYPYKSMPTKKPPLRIRGATQTNKKNTAQ